MLLDAFNQVSAQEYVWFGRICWLKNSKMAVSILQEVFHHVFDQENIWFGRRCW